MPLLDLNEVRMFVQVVRARSFAEAARRLTIPANTLSRRIRQLESHLETRLMQRSTRKLTLTTAGQAFFERCAPAVDGVAEAGKELVQGRQTPSGTVRIAAPADFLDLFRIEWVAAFLARHPQVQLDFVLDDARADLIGDAIDLAIRAGPAEDSLSTFREVTAQHFNLVASAGYLAVRGRPRSVQDLGRHDCLITSGQHSRATWTLVGPAGAEEVRVTGRFSANSARILLKSCLAGLGIALLPAMLIATDLKAGRLEHILPNYRRDGASLNIVVPSRQQMPSAVFAFIEFALAKLETLFVEPARRGQEHTS